LVEAKRTIGLLVLLVAAIVVLAGPVAEVLDLPAPVTEAKKKKKKKINVVQCADAGFECVGTGRRDRLVGTPGAENILGGEGNDIYQANGGNSFLIDRSVTSSDFYSNVDPGEGRNTIVFDDGGSADFLDMSSFRALDDIGFIRFNNGSPGVADELILIFERPSGGKVVISEYFGKGRIESIRFANGSITGRQAESLAREATSEEKAEIEEQLGDHLPEVELASQNEK